MMPGAIDAVKLARVLADARRLRERGPGSMYPEDEARHMADGVLNLLIELLEILQTEGTSN